MTKLRYELRVWNNDGDETSKGFPSRAEAKAAFDDAIVHDSCKSAAVYDLESDGWRVGKATHHTLWAFPSWWDGHT